MLQQHVRDSSVLVLLQSTNVLSRPYCLLELVTAIDASVPVLGVTLTSSQYDFAGALQLLTHLDTLLDQVNPGAGALLRSQGVDLEDASYKLANTLPNIISLKLDTSASRAVLSATLSDLLAALGTVKLPPLPPKEEWLRQRCHALPTATSEHGTADSPGARRGIVHSIGGVKRGKGAAARLPRQVPKLPDAHSPRAEALEKLVGRLTGTEAMSVVVARGMGGIGKTVIAAAVVRDPRVLSAFDRIGWVSVGQKPIVAELQKSLLQQLGASVPASVDEHTLLEALQAAASGMRLLLVVDDPWRPEQLEMLDFVDAEAGGKCLVTTRLRNLVPNQGTCEVELSLLSKEGAVALLLAAGNVTLPPGQPAPAAALAAVELCGRLPLCISIAGGMLREHEDDWEDWLVPALSESHGAELRTRSVCEAGVTGSNGASDVGSIEERVLRTSLRSIKREERDGVSALFLFTAVFAEDVTIPAAVLDALAREIVAEADAHAASVLGAASPEKLATRAANMAEGGHFLAAERPVLRRGQTYVSSVRRWLRIALDHSLVLGSISEGVRMHDLVRDFSRSLAAARSEGGLAQMQRRALSALLAAAPEGGFVDLSLATEAERGSELSLYVSVQMPFHLQEAFPPEVPVASADGVLSDVVSCMLLADERHDVNAMRVHAGHGIEPEPEAEP